MESQKQNLTLTVKLCNSIKATPVNSRIISQSVASSGSVEADYAEASEAVSKKYFAKCLKTAREKAKEFSIWLTGLKASGDIPVPEFDKLLQEPREFVYIFTSILKKVDV